MQHCQGLIDTAMSGLEPDVLTVEEGKKYLRIVRTSSGGYRSVYCFVDRESGDILKAASWAKPATGARGNISRPGGLYRMTAYGAGYNR